MSIFYLCSNRECLFHTFAHCYSACLLSAAHRVFLLIFVDFRWLLAVFFRCSHTEHLNRYISAFQERDNKKIGDASCNNWRALHSVDRKKAVSFEILRPLVCIFSTLFLSRSPFIWLLGMNVAWMAAKCIRSYSIPKQCRHKLHFIEQFHQVVLFTFSMRFFLILFHCSD